MNFWEQIFLDNSVRQYAMVASIVLVAYVFKRFIGRYVSWLFFFLMQRMGRVIERKEFIDMIVEPVEKFLFVFISYLALRSLVFPKILIVSFRKIATPDITEAIGETLLIWFFFQMLLRLVDYVAFVMGKKADLTPEQDDNQLVVFFKDFLKVVIIIIGALTMISVVFHKEITNILAGFSIIAAAMALAARESLENLIASFIIFFDKPFTTGDLLKVNSITGTVEKIGLRSTRIRTAEKTYVTVPNKQMVDSIVDNMSLRTHRRAEFKLVLDNHNTAEQVRALLSGIKEILKDQRIVDSNVFLADVAAEGYTITVDYLSGQLEFKSFSIMKEEVQLRIIETVEKMNLQMAGSERSVRIITDQPSSPQGNASVVPTA
ncbi:MAG: mechanosensitive ion channel protein MscS [Sphingobacteriales bacterium]|nr:MAG: mechanosensitive ion channel protein MscS [Sphingobacteriales bacterium]